MTAGIERLQEDMGKIIRSNPILHLATVALTLEASTSMGRPHSSTVWFAPDDDLKQLFWLSSPRRHHSQDIDSFTWFKGVGDHDGKAPVSGSMNLLTRPSQPVLGLSFEGHAYRIDDAPNKERAIGVLVAKRVFFPDEAEAYLAPPEDSTMPTHAVYAAEVSSWTHFDGMEAPENRKSVFNL